MKNIILYIIPAMIWGSTWYVITYQVGEVDAIISVSYRFALAGIILFLYSAFRKLTLSFNVKEHFLFLLQGLFLFGFNYWLVYMSEETLTSGLVALIFSTMVVSNIINSRLFLKNHIPIKVYGGALLGLTGIVLIFKDDLSAFSLTDSSSIALLYAFGGSYIASLGNIVSAYNQSKKLPIVQSNAFGMIYGSLSMLIIGLASGSTLRFSAEFSYTLSLLYLALFGSIIAFGAYLSLIGRIGASRAGYVQLVVPIIALIFSTIFEGYEWNIIALLGVLLILGGNFIVLEKRKTKQAPS